MDKQEILEEARRKLFDLTGELYDVVAFPGHGPPRPRDRKQDIEIPTEIAFREACISGVCESYGVAHSDFVARSRKKPLPEMRGMVANLLLLRGWTEKNAGATWGFDHSTINHHKQNHAVWVKNNLEYRIKWNKVLSTLRESGFHYSLFGNGEVKITNGHNGNLY